MVLMRRQIESVDPHDLLEAESDQESSDGVKKQEASDSGLVAKDERKHQTAPNDNVTSDLFILDHTGEEDYKGASSTVRDNQEQSKGYGISLKRKRNRRKKNEKNENPLSKLLPGYTAPMQLDTSSLNRYRAADGIKGLQRRAQLSDASTRGFVIEATKKHADVMQSKTNGMVASSYTDVYASFKKGTKRAPDKTAGNGWFGMVPTPMTEELKADLAVIRNRNYLDPKKFYKSADKQGSVVQLGTVIEGAAEYYSSRLTKKQRRNNFTEEIMADPQSADYAKKKFRSMAQEKTREAKQRSRVHRPKRGKRLMS